MKIKLPKNLNPSQIDKIIAELSRIKQDILNRKQFIDVVDLEAEFIKAINDEINNWQEIIIDRINKLSHKKSLGFHYKRIEANVLEDLVQINSQPLKEMILDNSVKAYIKGYNRGEKDVKKAIVEPDEYAMGWLRENSLMVSSSVTAEAAGKLKSELYFGLAGAEDPKKLANRVRGVLNKPQRIVNEINEAKAKIGLNRAVKEVGRRYGATAAQIEALLMQIKEKVDPEKAIKNLGIAKAYADKKAEIVAISETAKAINMGRLDAYEKSGVVQRVEILVAVDERTCPDCLALEGEAMTIDEARALIPVHSRCRCTVIPIVRTR